MKPAFWISGTALMGVLLACWDCWSVMLKLGIDGIPTRWLEQLRGFEIVEPLLDRLMQT